MRANDNFKIKAGDILYRVDPQKLIITRANVVEVSGGFGSVTRENRTSFHEKFKSLIKIALDRFPSEYNGILYFRTEDEAEKFVKTQIGL